MTSGNGSSSFSLFSRVAAAACQGAFLILLARTANLAQFGIYSTTCAIGAILIGFLSAGLPNRALQITEPKSSIGGSYLAAAIVLSATAFLATLLASATSLGSLSWIMVSAATFTAAELQNNIAQSYLYGLKKNKEADIFTLLRRALPLAAVAAASTLRPSWDKFAIISGCFALAWLAGAIRFLGQYNFKSLHKNALRGGSNYWLINIWTMLQQLDVILINAFLGSHLSGLYASAVRLASPVHIITSLIASRLVPNLRHAESSSERQAIWEKTYKPLRLALLLLAATSPALFWIAPMLFKADAASQNFVYVAAFCAALLSLLCQILSACLYTKNQEAAVQRLTRLSVFTGLVIVSIGSYAGSFTVAALGILCSKIILAWFLTKSNGTNRWTGKAEASS